MEQVDATTIREAVARRRHDLVALIQALVRTPSVTGEEGEVQRLVARRMLEAGLEIDVWEPIAADLAPFADHVGAFDSLAGRPNVAGRWAGSGGGRSLILNAHIDTVETGDPNRWTHPPFAGELAEGRVYGRGACDMKAGLATHLMAVAVLRDLGLQPRGDIIVQSVISEEDGGAGTLAAILRGYQADAAIITEPTNLAIMAAVGGSLVFRVHVPGKSAHACVRDEGVSAIEKFAVLHRALLDFERRRNAAIDHPLYRDKANKIPINIGVVKSGAWPSSVPESLIAEGRAGLVPGEDVAAFKREFVAEIDRAADGDAWLRDHRPVVEWFSGQFAPAEIAAEAPIIQALAAGHRAVTGREAALDGATYGADMRHFLLFGETPCVMYGAGDVRLAHYTDESVPVEDVVTATATIAATIVSWCGVERAGNPPRLSGD